MIINYKIKIHNFYLGGFVWPSCNAELAISSSIYFIIPLANALRVHQIQLKHEINIKISNFKTNDIGAMKDNLSVPYLCFPCVEFAFMPMDTAASQGPLT